MNSQWFWDIGDDPPAAPSAVPAGVSWVDVDGFDTTAAEVAAYHVAGYHVVCYIDVGTAENWRPDYSQFPAALLGSSNGWAGELWIDTSPTGPDYATLQSIMTARFKMCASKGFDAVEPDNLDVSENSGTGVTETVAQGDQYAEWIASEVHSLGMTVAQKNFEDQSNVLEPYFNFEIEEQCYQYQDCSDLQPYITAGKGVFDVEYPNSVSASSCPTKGLVAGVNVMLEGINLTASPRYVCPTPAA